MEVFEDQNQLELDDIKLYNIVNSNETYYRQQVDNHYCHSNSFSLWC
jgi:hypothetical protein